jgi:deoxycytidine triphosphate deaminase
MATILNDAELKKLIGTVIQDGDPSCIRPNSYILRLGSKGEFLNSGKLFTLGDAKKGIRIQPGHSVGLTALETVDFRPTTVQKLYPNCALHAFISPTTDLAREGIVAPTTQVDAGYNGTLNWTIANTSSEERRFICRERLFRLTILRLEEGEVPLKYYEGDYQDQKGYVRSARKGAPVGMRESEWEDSLVEGGPEALLDNLMKSGFPWHALGQRLKTIDDQFRIISNEYSAIDDSLQKLTREVDSLKEQYGDVQRSLPQMISNIISEQATALQNRWLISSGSILLGLLGLIITITSSKAALDFLKANSAWIGLVLILIGVGTMIFTARKTKK